MLLSTCKDAGSTSENPPFGGFSFVKIGAYQQPAVVGDFAPAWSMVNVPQAVSLLACVPCGVAEIA
ncbi:hypothetical protein D9M72_616840 [compost metagenome]